MNLFSRSILIFLTLIFTFSAQAEPNVVASIKPLHSLVAGVMKGVGVPTLVIDGNASPHSYSLKPSQAQSLQGARVIFWIGPGMESGLENQIETLGASARVVEMMDVPGITRLDLREGGAFEGHSHDDPGDGEGHDEHDGHDDTHEGHDDGHEEAHDGDDHEVFDTHIWLDPKNARAMVLVIAATLSESDPENASTYASNASKLTARLQVLEDEIMNMVAPFKTRPVIVYHDAYRHFENRFGLNVVGSLSNNPESSPGAARIGELRDRIKALGAVCVLSEPQFSSTLIELLVENTEAKTGTIDPLGNSLANGPELYIELLQNMATSIGACLEG